MNGHKRTVPTNVQTQAATPGNRVQGTEKLTFYFKKIDFQLLTDFRLLRQVKVNSIKNCDFLKFVIYVRADFVTVRRWHPTNLATPLHPTAHDCATRIKVILTKKRII
jgi:hypothetical protein